MEDPTGQQHMRRLEVVWQRQPLYFITTCVSGRRSLLANPATHAVLRAEWRTWRTRYGWVAGRYVIMPDHVHFFCMPLLDTASALSLVVGKWKEWTAKVIGHQTGITGSLWQPEFFDHLIRGRESYAKKWEYVRQNPVRAGLVTTPEAWPYAGWINFW